MLKRLFDLITAFLGLVFLWPLFLFAALWIRMDSEGPLFFLQSRVGRNGELFKIFKFRTMLHNSSGSLITVDGDRRITKSGHFLRKYKLDELPQLINVLKGEMSFVGPRPEVKEFVDLYSKDQQSVLDYLPGITDPASLRYRNESEILSKQQNPRDYYINVVMPKKIEINLSYAQKATVLTDVGLILKTILVSIRG